MHPRNRGGEGQRMHIASCIPDKLFPSLPPSVPPSLSLSLSPPLSRAWFVPEPSHKGALFCAGVLVQKNGHLAFRTFPWPAADTVPLPSVAGESSSFGSPALLQKTNHGKNAKTQSPFVSTLHAIYVSTTAGDKNDSKNPTQTVFVPDIMSPKQNPEVAKSCIISPSTAP